MPAKKKPDESRQRRNRPKTLELVPVDHAASRELRHRTPPAPFGLLRRTRDRWKDYWRSDVGQLADPVSDLPALRRLFTLYDQHDRFMDAVRSETMVEGSKGQPVLNPLWRVLDSMATEIRLLEDRFGCNPRARLSLGLQLAAGAQTLDSLNARIAAVDVPEISDVDHDDVDEADAT